MRSFWEWNGKQNHETHDPAKLTKATYADTYCPGSVLLETQISQTHDPTKNDARDLRRHRRPWVCSLGQLSAHRQTTPPI